MAGGGAIAGIVIAVVIGVPLLLFLCLYLLKKWMQGPTAGTDNPRRLDEKVVVITGTHSLLFDTSHGILFKEIRN